MAPTLPQFNPARLRTYIFRLPLFTRVIVLLIVLLWMLSMQSVWNVTQWGALIPEDVNLSTSRLPRTWSMTRLMLLPQAYRLNTFPLVHVNFIHALINLLALAPLLERFEAEHGTLLSLALFFGRMCCFRGLARVLADTHVIALSTLPGGLYLLFERVAFRGNTAVMGARYGRRGPARSTGR